MRMIGFINQDDLISMVESGRRYKKRQEPQSRPTEIGLQEFKSKVQEREMVNPEENEGKGIRPNDVIM